MDNVSTPKTQKDKKNIRGRGRPPGRSQDRILHMRVNDELIRTIDDWRRMEGDIPERTEAVRRMIRLAADRKK